MDTKVDTKVEQVAEMIAKEVRMYLDEPLPKGQLLGLAYRIVAMLKEK